MPFVCILGVLQSNRSPHLTLPLPTRPCFCPVPAPPTSALAAASGGTSVAGSRGHWEAAALLPQAATAGA